MKNYLIVGLGNIGSKYELTRHNLGFTVVNRILHDHGLPPLVEKSRFKSLITEGEINGRRALLAEPTTFMNNSGQAVYAIANFYQIPPQNIVVIHDELDLEFGDIRVKLGGSSAGHKGVESVINHLGNDKFYRVRIGIRNDLLGKQGAESFVLSKFNKAEQDNLPKIVAKATKEAVDTISK